MEIMKINFPTTYDGWIKLGKSIIARSKKLEDEPPVNPADADILKINALTLSADEKLKLAAEQRRASEINTEEATHEMAELEDEIRRLGRVLTGRNRKNPRRTGVWGYNMDESSPGSDEKPKGE